MMIGKNIKELRLSHSLTQKDLAQQISLTPKMISYYERNERIPPIDILMKLSTIFNITLDQLVGFNSGQVPLLSPDDKKIIKVYHCLNDEYKAIAYGELLKLKKEQEQEYSQTAKRKIPKAD